MHRLNHPHTSSVTTSSQTNLILRQYLSVVKHLSPHATCLITQCAASYSNVMCVLLFITVSSASKTLYFNNFLIAVDTVSHLAAQC